MAQPDTDLNVLFGVLAVQAGLVDAGRFARAWAEWAAAPERPLADVLVERGLLTTEDRSLVNRLLARRAPPGDGLDGESAAVGPESKARQGRPPTTVYRPGTRSRYALTRLYARGGLGQVWLARDEDLGREVALKELRPDRADDAALWARFLEEARITGQLEHPGVVPVYELGRGDSDGQPFYTMRFVRGRSLDAAVKEYHGRRARRRAGPLEFRELLGDFIGVCNAVAYAHSRRVIHRDLKPQNVILGEFGEVVVLDWGVAKDLGSGEGITKVLPVEPLPEAAPGQTVPGEILGTPAYMSPEQAEGRHDLLDERTDVYSLGAVLYEILTGSPPFSGKDTREILRRVVVQPPVPPSQRVAGAPRPLEAVCLKALAKPPEDRYGSAKELAQEIRRWLADEPVAAYREPPPARAARWMRRHRALAPAAYGAVLVFLLIQTVASLATRDSVRAEKEKLGTADRERAQARMTADSHELELASARARLAREYRNVGQTARARETLARAIASYDRLKARQPEAQTVRATGLALAGDHARAATEADSALSQGTDAETLYGVACAYALAAAAAGRDPNLASDTRQELIARYAGRAVDLLRRAAALRLPGAAHRLERDADLAALRPRPDFQELRRELKARGRV